MVILGHDTRQERLEIMLWTAGRGVETPAVRRFRVRHQVTLAAALVTRGDGEQARWN